MAQGTHYCCQQMSELSQNTEMIISECFPKAKNCGPTLHLHAAACCVIQIGNQSSDGRQIQELETSRKSENHKPKIAVLEPTSKTIPSSCSHLLITVHSLQLDTPLMQANVQCIFVLFEFLPDFCSPSKQRTPSVPSTPRILYLFTRGT